MIGIFVFSKFACTATKSINLNSSSFSFFFFFLLSIFPRGLVSRVHTGFDSYFNASELASIFLGQFGLLAFNRESCKEISQNSEDPPFAIFIFDSFQAKSFWEPQNQNGYSCSGMKNSMMASARTN